jgi:uncharacterized membrane protein
MVVVPDVDHCTSRDELSETKYLISCEAIIVALIFIGGSFRADILRPLVVVSGPLSTSRRTL